MARQEDLRIIKTKLALTNAFFEMLEDMPLDDVTVNALCEKAEVRRATFYKHFKDRHDFIISLSRTCVTDSITRSGKRISILI